MSDQDIAKRSLSMIIGLAIAAVVLLAGFIVPRIQSAHFVASQAADAHLEQARRLLLKYDTNLSLDTDYRSLLGSELLSLSSEQISALMETSDITDEVNAELTEYARQPGVKRLATAEEDMLRLAHGDSWGDHRSTPPPSRMSGAKMLNQAGQEYNRRLDANNKLLNEALGEANAAVSAARDEAPGGVLASAHRLVGLVYYQQGLAQSRLVTLMRRYLAARRFALKRDAAGLATALQRQQIVQASEIDARIEGARTAQRDAAAALAQQQGVVAQVQAQVDTLQQQLQSALGRSAAARETMETLQDLGMDLSDPGGFERFRSAYLEHARRYRQALKESHILRYGALDNAVIDYTGDYIAGRYVPVDADTGIQLRNGLAHYQQELDAAQAADEKMTAIVAGAQDNLEKLEALRRFLTSQQDMALEASSEIRERMAMAYSEFVAAEDLLQQAEDQAIGLFEKAARGFRDATRGAEENWLRGQLAAQQGDALLRTAMIHLGRRQDGVASLQDLSAIEPAKDRAADWEQQAQAARQAAIESAEAAIDLLQTQAKPKIGGGDWIVAAEIGAAHYLLSLLNVELASERAFEWYKAALENREEIAIEHASMRDHIQARLNQQQRRP